MNPQMSRSADVPFTFANMGDQSPMPPSRGPESSGPHLFVEKPTFFALAAAFAFPLRRDVVC